jgi:hypothetical protein
VNDLDEITEISQVVGNTDAIQNLVGGEKLEVQFADLEQHAERFDFRIRQRSAVENHLEFLHKASYLKVADR